MIDFAKFKEIAVLIGAKLMVDMAHIAGLVAADLHASPMPQDMAKGLNKSIFSGIQGGPLMHIIAAKAVCFGEALNPSFKAYAAKVVRNANSLLNRLSMREPD